MGVSTISNLSNSLRRTYSNRYFRAFQNDFTPVLNALDECPDEPTRGSAWYFPFHMSSPQNWRVAAEGGSMGTVQQRTEVQGSVNAVEFLGWMQISELLKNAGTKDAAWNGGELNRQMKETTTDITKGMQRMFVISHGTGRLGVVEAGTTGTTSFVGTLDEGVQCLMDNDLVEFYTGDSGGTITAGTTTSRKVDKIVKGTRTVTLTAAATLLANDGVYRAGDYGRGSQGFHGQVDDGTFQITLNGQSRNTYEKLKSSVADPGSPTPLTEQHMRAICDEIYQNGGEISDIWCGPGVMNAYYDVSTGNRRYNIERGQSAKFTLGYKEGDALFSYDKGSVTLKKDPNIPARTMYFLSLKQSFMKHTLRKLGWLDEGGSILRLTPNGSDGFNTSWTALIYAACNTSCMSPIWNGVRRNIKDESIAGDS
jgi:hypothetical protein